MDACRNEPMDSWTVIPKVALQPENQTKQRREQIMNRTIQIVTVMIFVATLMIARPINGWSQIAGTAQGHAELAKTYHEKADFNRQVVSLFRQGKEANGRPAWVLSARSNTPTVRKTDAYYDSVIREAETTARKLEVLASWHQMRAIEEKAR